MKHKRKLSDKIGNFLCRRFGKHKPDENIIPNHFCLESHCKYCGKLLIQDYYGNWFEPKGFVKTLIMEEMEEEEKRESEENDDNEYRVD